MEFTERMEAGRNTAAARRHRGLTTGKSAKGWDVKRRLDDCPIARAKVAWQMAKGDAIEIYERAVFPERYSTLTIDDVITARIDAELAAIPF